MTYSAGNISWNSFQYQLSLIRQIIETDKGCWYVTCERHRKKQNTKYIHIHWSFRFENLIFELGSEFYLLDILTRNSEFIHVIGGSSEFTNKVDISHFIRNHRFAQRFSENHSPHLLPDFFMNSAEIKLIFEAPF